MLAVLVRSPLQSIRFGKSAHAEPSSGTRHVVILAIGRARSWAGIGGFGVVLRVAVWSETKCDELCLRDPRDRQSAGVLALRRDLGKGRGRRPGAADLTVAGGVTLGAAPLVYGGKAAATFARSASGRASRRTSYGAADVSFEGWFRCDDLATQRQAIFFNGSGNNGFGLVLNGHSVTGQLSVLFQNVDWLTINYSPGTGVHHFVLTLAGSNPVTLTLYVDGVQVWAHTRTPPNAPSGGFTIGAETTAGRGGFTGAIDDFFVYNGVLDAATALAHYNAGKAPAPVGEALGPPPGGLGIAVARLPFDRQ